MTTPAENEGLLDFHFTNHSEGKPPGSSEMKAIKENREKNSAHIKAVTNIRPTPSSTPKKKPIHREKRTAQIDEEAVPEEAPPTLVPQREGPGMTNSLLSFLFLVVRFCTATHQTHPQSTYLFSTYQD